MNGELVNMIQLTLTAKQYIRTGKFEKSLTKSRQIEGYDFNFVEQDFGQKAPAAQVDSCEKWVSMLKERGARDFKFIMVDEMDDFARLSRANGIQCCIICFYDDGVTSWNRRWLYNPSSQKWHVQLVESIARNVPDEKPRFKDMSQDMVTLLERLRFLSQKLGLSDFSFQFHVAQKSLQANFVSSDNMMQSAQRRLLAAAIDAYVFDGENSWLEKGRAAAEEKGMLEEYDELTNYLFRGIALSCMYAVNEW